MFYGILSPWKYLETLWRCVALRFYHWILLYPISFQEFCIDMHYKHSSFFIHWTIQSYQVSNYWWYRDDDSINSNGFSLFSSIHLLKHILLKASDWIPSQQYQPTVSVPYCEKLCWISYACCFDFLHAKAFWKRNCRNTSGKVDTWQWKQHSSYGKYVLLTYQNSFCIRLFCKSTNRSTQYLIWSPILFESLYQTCENIKSSVDL